MTDGALARRGFKTEQHCERGVGFDRDRIGGQEQRRVQVGHAIRVRLPARLGFAVDGQRGFVARACRVGERLGEFDLHRLRRAPGILPGLGVRFSRVTRLVSGLLIFGSGFPAGRRGHVVGITM